VDRLVIGEALNLLVSLASEANAAREKYGGIRGSTTPTKDVTSNLDFPSP
jgi:hypothetical protein